MLLVCRTTRLAYNQILTEACTFPTMAQNHPKKYLSFSMRNHGFSISSPSPLILCRCPLCLLAFHLLLFPSCLSSPPPPSPLRSPPTLSPQSISLQWSGRLTAAPPEEYQSMLLWRQKQTPLFYFPLFFFSSIGLACGCL